MAFVPTVSGDPSTIGKTTTERKANDELGKDDFLKLMITQLQWQDPMSPMDDKESIAQLAQFTALEQMTNMTNSMASMQATTSIGKTVTWNDDKGKTHSGIVKQVNIVNSKAQLMMNDIEINSSKLVDIANPDKIKVITDLIGTQVTYVNGEGKTVTGTVSAIKLLNGKTYKDELKPEDIDLMIEGDRVYLDKVTSIKNTPV